MVVVLNKQTAAALKKEFRSKRKTTKKFNAKKFNGILKLNEDALKTQKKMRNEWQ